MWHFVNNLLVPLCSEDFSLEDEKNNFNIHIKVVGGSQKEKWINNTAVFNFNSLQFIN